MSVTGLFSGIGGFELAFKEAGFEPDLLVEVDDCAAAVLKARFPGTELRSDVMDLIDIPKGTQVLTSGFPCQNLSMAGDKSGINGAKSSVVKKMFDLIRRSHVPIVVIENVYFMLHLESGNAMRWLVDQFEHLGYRWAYRVLDTMGFGLPQRRRRVYFIATLGIDPRTVLFADEGPAAARKTPNLSRPLGFYWTEGRSGVGLTIDGIPPLKVGSALGIPSAPAVLFPDGEVLTPSLKACERLQGFPPGWTAADEKPSGKRDPKWRMVGNAVSVPVARWVAERIKQPGTILDIESLPLREGQRWPDAAWNAGEGPVEVKASDKPTAVTTPSISEFRDLTWSRLSNRALNGFIRRAEEGGLRMPEGFLEALRKATRRTSHPQNEP
jgi:DNA (cytosine-5)-methyltransferase 1